MDSRFCSPCPTSIRSTSGACLVSACASVGPRHQAVRRLRRSIGEPLALVALRRYLARGGRRAALVELARPLDILGPIRAAVDVLEAS